MRKPNCLIFQNLTEKQLQKLIKNFKANHTQVKRVCVKAVKK